MSDERITERGLGAYRQDLIELCGVWVSTILRESSAMEHRQPYFETMAFALAPHERGILWQSGAGFEKSADRHHDLAVRWFSRPHRDPAFLARYVATRRPLVAPSSGVSR